MENQSLNNSTTGNISELPSGSTYSAAAGRHNNWQLKEALFKKVLLLSGTVLFVIIGGILISLIYGSWPAIKEFGFGFLWSKEWDPVFGKYGSLPFMVGTLVTSFLALILSLPFSLSISIMLGEYFRSGWLSAFVKTMTELLAGIPSVIYGLWGLFVIVPLVQELQMKFEILPYGVGIFTASILLALMIIPYTASIAREVIKLVPNDLKEAAYSLGATRFEVIRYIIIPYSFSGIFAGVLLSLGRALGETMAVTMLIGNANVIPDGLFAPGNTMASVIANQFAEATETVHTASLIEIGLVLLLVSAVINITGKYIIKRFSHDA